MKNVAIVVEEEPSRPGLLGLYEGRPLATRSVFDDGRPKVEKQTASANPFSPRTANFMFIRTIEKLALLGNFLRGRERVENHMIAKLDTDIESLCGRRTILCVPESDGVFHSNLYMRARHHRRRQEEP